MKDISELLAQLTAEFGHLIKNISIVELAVPRSVCKNRWGNGGFSMLEKGDPGGHLRRRLREYLEEDDIVRFEDDFGRG